MTERRKGKEWKKAIVANFKLLSQHFPAGTEENNENFNKADLYAVSEARDHQSTNQDATLLLLYTYHYF
jgi:hypothetical protein